VLPVTEVPAIPGFRPVLEDLDLRALSVTHEFACDGRPGDVLTRSGLTVVVDDEQRLELDRVGAVPDLLDLYDVSLRDFVLFSARADYGVNGGFSS
jgi:hypothetical protein